MAKTLITTAGATRLTLQAAVAAAIGDLIGYDGAAWVLADADGRIPAEFMATETVGIGQSVAVCTSGVLSDTAAPYTSGQDRYLTTTAGAHGALPALSTTLTILQRIGKAVTTTDLAFDLSKRGPIILRANVIYDPAALGGVSVRNDTVALTGLLTSDYIRGAELANVALEGGLVINMMDVSAADTLRIRLNNPSAGALDGASLTHAILVERF